MRSNSIKKRVSKKRKIAWRKHVDIKDVEEFLEEKRVEERMGKPLHIISDTDLFKIDTNQQVVLTKTEKRKILASTLPKCYSMLQPHTEVPDPLIKRNRVRTKEERMNPWLKQKESERKKEGILKPKEAQSLKDKRNYELLKTKTPDKFPSDLWTVHTAKNKPELAINSDWISTHTKIHSLNGQGKTNKTLTKSFKMTRKNQMKSVDLPHPGTSYNPSFKDHQDLLKAIAEKENKIIKEEKHLARVTRDMFTKISEKEKESNWLTEMSAGLSEMSKSQNEDDEAEDQCDKKIVQTKPKTLKQKRKQKEQLLLKAALKKSKIEKKKISDIYKLKVIEKAIDMKDMKAQKLREKRKSKLQHKSKEPQRLGPKKFEEIDLEFNSTNDISGNLRCLKKEGNLLADRFKSLQRRSILPPTVLVNPKKAKVKKYVKPGHKDDWKVTIAGFNRKNLTL